MVADSALASSETFVPNSRGYIRHWLVSGPIQTPYTGKPAPEHVLRREAIDPEIKTPPFDASLNGAAPGGGSWRFYYPGNNHFVEFSAFYQSLTHLDHHAYTQIVAPHGGERQVRLWSAGVCDLWVNGEHLTRLAVTRYRNPDLRDLTIRLKEGTNRLFVRLQCMGVRDTRILFGLSFAEAEDIQIQVPGAAEPAQSAKWLDSLQGESNSRLRANGPAPAGTSIRLDGQKTEWPKASSVLEIGKAMLVEIATPEDLTRAFDFPGNREPAGAPAGDRKTAHLAFIAKAGEPGENPSSWNAALLPVIARRLLKQTASRDKEDFRKAIDAVRGRHDCADFALSALLRLEYLKLSLPEESEEIRDVALNFRYWSDEPGNDAMCFHSENHTLLFHGCQLLAGSLYPDSCFTNSGKTGRELVQIAVPRIEAWIKRIEARGFEEFNSGTYMPLTIAAMLNVIDFGGDEELARRMWPLVDQIYSDLASHSFGGGVITPQGRAYRDILFPEEAGAQTLLALAAEATDVHLSGSRPSRPRTGDWAVFPATSRYTPPENLNNLVQEAISKVSRHADFEIVLEKKPEFILTSLSVPAVPRPGESPDNDLRPGGAGYQQHLWQATLGYDCHIFVNHPGGTYEGSMSRPGYWNGSGLLPRVRQTGNVLQAIHVIADGSKTEPPITEQVWLWASASTIRPYDVHPVPFTHAHWPSDSFDDEVRKGNWVFGRKGKGMAALWCSEPLTPHDDRLSGRELRADAWSSAWLIICGGMDHDGPMEKFMESCERRNPRFDRATYVMKVDGLPDLKWWERAEPMPS